MVDVAPRELGDVDQPVHPVQVDEGAEVDDVRDRAVDDVARVEPVENLLALVLALVLAGGAAGGGDAGARRERTTLLRDRFSSITLQRSSVDMNSSRSWTRRMSTSEAGRKPRTPRSRMSPPLTTSMTLPVDRK